MERGARLEQGLQVGEEGGTNRSIHGSVIAGEGRLHPIADAHDLAIDVAYPPGRRVPPLVPSSSLMTLTIFSTLGMFSTSSG